jgi:integrase
MRGHIRAWGKKPGTFKIWLEHPTVDGKRQRETLVVHGSKKDAEAKMADRIAQIERGDYSRSDHSTVAQAAEQWLKARKGSVGARTLSGYEAVVRDYINAAFGELRLRKLTPLHVEHALAKWREGNGVKKRKVKRQLKPRSVHRIYATLNAFLKQAVRWNMIVRNPCDAVNAPSRGRAEIAALDEDKAVALIAGLRGTSLAAPAHLTLLTALRRSELLGLKWKDVDFDRRVLNVRRALEQIKGSVSAFKDTKTLKSRRQVPLTSEAIDVLTAHRAGQNAIKLRAPGYNPEGLVFPEVATGAVWDPGKFSGAFRRAARRLKIGITFHGLRHSWATIALRERVPMKLVSAALGHSTTAFTMDTYMHVLDDMQHEAADRVGEAFAAARRRSSTGA